MSVHAKGPATDQTRETQDFSEVEQTLSESERKLQASRCMDCGVPFCHGMPTGQQTA